MKRRRPTTIPLGTISEGTLRPEDLIPAYISVLEDLRLTKAERAQLFSIQRRTKIYERDDDWTLDQASYDLDDLISIIENHLPDYSYFGSLEGDGACFGVWATIPDSDDDQVFRRNDTPPSSMNQSWQSTDEGTRYRKGNYPYWLHVNDHGNATLYRRAGNRWIEVWGIV
jgi:hypothetical protein